jgi:hypothetical protein
MSKFDFNEILHFDLGFGVNNNFVVHELRHGNSGRCLVS